MTLCCVKKVKATFCRVNSPSPKKLLSLTNKQKTQDVCVLIGKTSC